jgi:hypothetical protein
VHLAILNTKNTSGHNFFWNKRLGAFLLTPFPLSAVAFVFFAKHKELQQCLNRGYLMGLVSLSGKLIRLNVSLNAIN